MLIRGIVATLGFYALAGGVFFGAAGRLDLPMAWSYLVAVTGASVGFIPALERHSPGLVAERMRPGPGERDRVSVPVFVGGLTGMWIIGGLDAGRFHWSGGLPLAVQIAALAGAMLGFAIAGWSMWVNPFFSSAVRIQAERRHALVSGGPYRFVRHPGYTGGVLYLAMTGPALGSWWSLLPLVPMAAVLIRRTMLEDLLLHQQLEGYADYARTVRFRLVPGLW
jgi:protein-S-isoprenylcysteine O-methyltransferase Ste14